MAKSTCGLSVSLLRWILSIFWVIGLLAIPALVLGTVFSIIYYRSLLNVIFSVLIMLAGVGILLIIFELRKITHSVLAREPFSIANVKSFRNIGVTCLGVGTVFFAYDLTRKGLMTFKILHSSGERGISSNLGVFLPFVLGLLALVMAEIFRMAHEIYEENKLTI